MRRSVSRVIESQKVNMGGIVLDQPLPSKGVDMIDPFLLIHHWNDTLPGGQQQTETGVGPHPHRGFTPVTFIFEGGVHHRDSTGLESIIRSGGTQWMNSGKGIIHSERPVKELAENGGKFEIIQFWINTPAKFKRDEPSYQPLNHEDTPIVKSDDGHIDMSVISGSINNVEGPLNGNSPLTILRLMGHENGHAEFQIPNNYNCLLYVLNGTLEVNGAKLSEKQMAIFNNDGDEFHLDIQKSTRAIILSGIPIDEPVVSYGPFVMNSEKEIKDAIKDYQSGKLGVLVETFDS